MNITLVRHGQSEANAGLTDGLDSDLTPLGHQQAQLTAERLRSIGLTQAYVSPLRRTLQTITPICAATGLRAEVYADICEYFSARWPGYKDFPGLSPDEITTQFPFAYFGDTFPCSAAWWPQELEDDALMCARALRVRNALLARHSGPEAHLLIVSHAETVGRLTEAFLHLPPDLQDPPWSDNCGVTLLHITHPAEPARLILQNDTSHLTALAAHAA